MPLQIEVTKVKIVDGTEGYRATINLTCWPDGVTKEYPVRNLDGTVDIKNAVVFHDKIVYIKGYVDGMTIAQLIDRIQPEVIVKLQEVIDTYNREDSLYNNPKFNTFITNVQGGLNG